MYLKFHHIILLCLSFVLSTKNLCAQEEKIIDSLRNVIKYATNDVIKVDTFNELSWSFLVSSKLKEAKYYATKAIETGKKVNYTEGIITGMMRLGDVNMLKEDYIEAKKVYLEILTKEEDRKNRFGIGRVKTSIASIYINLGEYDKALQFAIESLDEFKAIKDIENQMKVMNLIGSIYNSKEKYEKALTYLLSVFTYEEENKNAHNLAAVSLNIGNLYLNIDDFTEAKKYLYSSLNYYKKIDNQLEVSKIYNSLGCVELKQNNYNKAQELFQKSLEIAIKNDISVNNIYNNIGITYYKQDDFNKALSYYLNAENNKNISGKTDVDAIINLADIYYRKGKINEAIKRYKKALLIIDNTSQITKKSKILYDLSLCYTATNNFGKALEYKNQYIVINDNINKEYINAKKTQVNYERELKNNTLLKKDKEIAVAKLNESIAKNNFQKTWIYGLLVAFLLVTMLFFSIIRGNKQKQKAQKAEIERQKVQEIINSQELKFNQARLDGQEKERSRIAKDLHDRLGSILSMVKIHYKSVEEDIEQLKESNKEQYDKANKLLDHACEEVRKIANNINSGLLTKFGLVPALEDLSETLRNSKQLQVEFNSHGIDNRLSSDVEISIFRIIQELINNILRHSKADEASIQLIQSEKTLTVMVEDNGIGFNINTSRKKGMGLLNVSSRIDSLNGDFEIDSNVDSGTTITIKIPINL